MDRRMQRAACRDLEKNVHESKNFFFPLVKCFPSEKSKSVKGSTVSGEKYETQPGRTKSESMKGRKLIYSGPEIDQRRVDVSTGISKVSCNEMCVSVGRSVRPSVGLSPCFLSGCAEVLF